MSSGWNSAKAPPAGGVEIAAPEILDGAQQPGLQGDTRLPAQQRARLADIRPALARIILRQRPVFEE